MTPRPSELFLERFPDPLTGWPMLGVGATWPATPADCALAVRYDGVTRLTHPIRQPASGAQLPSEPNVSRIQVVLISGPDEVLLREFTFDEVRERGQPKSVAKPLPRWLSPFATVSRAARGGELFTRPWWAARVNRYGEFANKLRRKLADRPAAAPSGGPYAAQIRVKQALPSPTADFTRWRHRATFSILTPVYNTDPRWLRAAVDSVRAQSYPHWQLVLADDASSRPETRALLGEYENDGRITVVRRATNGHIVAASNSAADAATGEFVALLDHDDTLDPHALFRYAELLNTRPELDLIYCDEDKLDDAATPYDPHFKPEFSPELLLSYNYVNHFLCIRKTVFDAAGHFRAGTDGAQDLDLILRVAELTDRVARVPEVLYHWRAAAESTAASVGVKPYVQTSATKAVADHLARLGVESRVENAAFAVPLGLPILTLAPLAAGPSVAVIIHGERESAALTARAVKLLTAYADHTTYLVLDTARRADALNRVAAGRTEHILVFLEAGVEPADVDWLGRLVAHLALPGVGAAGGLVRTPDGAVVSAGTLRGDPPAHAFAGQRPNPVSYYFLAESTRTVTAPGRGVLAVRRDTFESAGGFDAERFPRTLYDLDFCLRLAGLGRRSVHVGPARFRAEPGRLDRRDAPSERANLRLAHGDAADPFTDPNLLPGGQFRIDPLPRTLTVPKPARPPEVLLVTHNLTALEGAPKVLRDVAIGLAARGEVVAHLTSPSPGSAEPPPGVTVRAEPSRFAPRFVDGQWTARDLATAQRELAATIRDAAPDVVVVNTLGLFPTVEASRAAGVPAIWVIHESLTPERLAATLTPPALAGCHRAFAAAERVVFVSDSCRDLYAHLDAASNFSIIRNAIELGVIDQFITATTRHDGGVTRFLTVGTVCERKAQHVLIEAAAILARTRRDFAVTLLGAREGLPYLSYCRHLAEARGVGNLVEFVAETPEVWPRYRAADVFVCCSHVEAFSLSVLEAMAFGLPVISTPCGGLTEQATWGETALEFPFDDATALAAAMLELLTDPAERARLGAEGRVAVGLMPTPNDLLDSYARLIHVAARSRR